MFELCVDVGSGELFAGFGLHAYFHNRFEGVRSRRSTHTSLPSPGRAHLAPTTPGSIAGAGTGNAGRRGKDRRTLGQYREAATGRAAGRRRRALQTSYHFADGGVVQRGTEAVTVRATKLL